MTQRNNRIEEYEESPLVVQRAIRDFQTGRSVACVAWNPHRGRECELAVGFSYWVGRGIVFHSKCYNRAFIYDHFTICHHYLG